MSDQNIHHKASGITE